MNGEERSAEAAQRIEPVLTCKHVQLRSTLYSPSHVLFAQMRNNKLRDKCHEVRHIEVHSHCKCRQRCVFIKGDLVTVPVAPTTPN